MLPGPAEDPTVQTTTAATDSRPHAIVYPNGAQLFVPEYHPTFVQRLKARVPAHTRIFHGGHNASYTIVAPHHWIALALAGEYFADFTRVFTNAPYEFPGDDRLLLLQRRRRGANFGQRTEEIARRNEIGGGR